MGYSLYLRGRGFDRTAWLDAVESGFAEGDGSMRIGISGIAAQLAGLEDGLDEEQVWLHPHRGIRGITAWTEEIFPKIPGIAKNHVQGFCQEILTGGVPTDMQILELGRLSQSGKIPREEADPIARNLCGLGMAIASASGGLLGFGSKISKEETAALIVLEIALMYGAGD